MHHSIFTVALGLLTGAMSYPWYAKRGSDDRPQVHARYGLPAEGKKGVFLLSRLGPSTAELYVANSDGSNERKLLGAQSVFEYHARFSADGQYITFTSERNGDGNADIWRVKSDGTGLEMLIGTPSVEDSGVLSPDGRFLAYASTAAGYKGNVWVKDLKTGHACNITNSLAIRGDPTLPDGYFRPEWSPDGKWIALTSDRNTRWRGHDNGTGWENTQELSIYLIRPDGSEFQLLANKTGYALGSPKWSPDGKRIVYYEMTVEDTWTSRIQPLVNFTSSQIISIDVATGKDRIQHTASPGVKIYPHFVTPEIIGYNIKGGELDGIDYTQNNDNLTWFGSGMRAPTWSPDGKTVVYERIAYQPARPLQKPLYSWQRDWEYRHSDSFPALSATNNKLALSILQTGPPAIAVENSDLSNLTNVFNPAKVLTGSLAIGSSWSPDAKSIAFSLGSFFTQRSTSPAWIYRTASDGSSYEQLAGDNSTNCGLPSYSHDGNYIVYRAWNAQGHQGLRTVDLRTKAITVLTTEWDNLPQFSPDGQKILFTRRVGSTTDEYKGNYDIFTIKPDGSDLKRLTTSGGNDAHAVWTADGRIMWGTGAHGWFAEAATYDNDFQPYANIAIMNGDGSNYRLLTDSFWEDGMPQFLPNSALKRN